MYIDVHLVKRLARCKVQDVLRECGQLIARGVLAIIMSLETVRACVDTDNLLLGYVCCGKQPQDNLGCPRPLCAQIMYDQLGRTRTRRAVLLLRKILILYSRGYSDISSVL